VLPVLRYKCNSSSEGKVHPRTGREGTETVEVWLYSFFNLDAREGVNARPHCFIPGKDYASIVQDAGWSPGLIWTAAENLTLSGFDPQTVQRILNRCTNDTVPACSSSSSSPECGTIPFTFYHSSIIVQVIEYSQSLKQCNLKMILICYGVVFYA